MSVTLESLLLDNSAGLDRIRQHLDGLTSAERVRQVVALSRPAQERLWELADQDPARLPLSYLLPDDAAPLQPRPFEGKNSLPLFTRFRKVFYRTGDGRIAGYNDQAMGWVTGPGYYIAHLSPAGAPGPLVIDYTQIPKDKPASWPSIKHNEAGLSRFVYGGTQDFLRYVSDHVVIGRAYRAQSGDPMPNWFVLVRPD